MRFVDGDGFQRQIDFLGEPAGVPLADLFELAVNVTLVVDGRDVRFRVMHQLHSLRSRAFNVAYIDGYQSDHGLNQLRAAIICARQYVIDLVANGEGDRALAANQEIFDIAHWKAGPLVNARHGIDVFAAVVASPGLNAQFLDKGYPVIQRQIAKQYARAARAHQRRRTRRKR